MFRRLINYIRVALGMKAEAMMDPTVQLEQAVQEARQQDQKLRESAARILANRSEMQMRLERGITATSKAKASAISALQKSKEATSKKDREKWATAANAFAMELSSQERMVESIKAQYETAEQQADLAHDQVKQNATRLRELTTRRMELMSKLEQAKMQEQVNATLESMNRPMPGSSVPNTAEIEDKINRRLALASGKAELEANSLEGTTRELEQSMMQVSGAERLAELEMEIEGTAVEEDPLELTQGAPVQDLGAELVKEPVSVEDKN